MFMWTLESISDAYNKYLPKVSQLTDEIGMLWGKNGYRVNISELYARMPKMPVDIGIMEQAENRIVIPVDYGWSDVGGWKALYDISKKDSNNNVMQCKSMSFDSFGNYINSNKYIAMIGVNNLVVVDTEDVLLIANIDKSENVKDVVSALEKDKLSNHLI